MKRLNKIVCVFLAIIMAFGMLTIGISSFAVATETSHQVGDIIEFGSYPQSRVTNQVIIDSLNALSADWQFYDYYVGVSGSNWPGFAGQKDYMSFADVVFSGESYRGVKFTQYRPQLTYYYNTGTYYQRENGYYKNTVYWFKYEPIRWRILDPSKGLIISEKVIDSQAFCNTVDCRYDSFSTDYYYHDYTNTHFANNYAVSSIRTWLNSTLYDKAFSYYEKFSINKTTISNNCSIETKKREKDPTDDYLFLLSYDDLQNAEYGFNSSTSIGDDNAKAQGSDYAKCQGLRVQSGFSPFRLRSSNSANAAYSIESDGTIGLNYALADISIGIRPAMCIDWESFDNNSGERLYITCSGLTSFNSANHLAIGETYQLTAFHYPSMEEINTGLTWYSSDPSVVSVNNSGVVTGVSKGYAYIYARTSTGLTAKHGYFLYVGDYEVTGAEEETKLPDCFYGHDWGIDTENVVFRCSVCNETQSVSPDLGYNFQTDKFSFSNTDVGSYYISGIGRQHIVGDLLLDIMSIMNNVKQGLNWNKEFPGACFGIATMNASFQNGISVYDYGQSRVSDLSVKNAGSLNQDTKLKDSINIMYATQNTISGSLFNGLFTDQKDMPYEIVKLARSLKPGDYPPIVNFTFFDDDGKTHYGHSVNIIGIEPYGFLDDYYVITTFDNNCTVFPYYFLISKDFSNAYYCMFNPNNNKVKSYQVRTIDYFITDPGYNIDRFAPGLKTDRFYTGLNSVQHVNSLQSRLSTNIEDDHSEYILINVPDTNSVVIEKDNSSISIEDGLVKNSSFEEYYTSSFVGAPLLRVILPYSPGTYKVSLSNDGYVIFNWNHNIGTLYCEAGGDVKYSPDGLISFIPTENDTYTELAYYKYDLLSNSDVIACFSNGNLSQESTINTCDGTIRIDGKDISEQLVFVQHNDDALTVDQLEIDKNRANDSISIVHDDTNNIERIEYHEEHTENETIETNESNCACGQYHTGPFAGLIRFIHSIIYFFKNLFGIK